MGFTVGDLAAATSGRVAAGDPLVVLDRLVTDSRAAGPGALFVALAGEAMDGHRFIRDAVSAGASAVLCESLPAGLRVAAVVVPDTREALVDFSRARLAAVGCRVVGVTGSAGKTTTKEMVAAVLARRLAVLRTEGNLNTYTGLPMTIARLEPGHQVLVAEYAMSAPGEIAFLARIAPPDVALVLNVGHAHVGMPGLGTIEAVAAAKQELVEALGDGGVAVLNRDDPRVMAMASHTQGRVVTFGLDPEGDGPAPDVYAAGLRDLGLDGSIFELVAPGGRAPVRLPLPGRHAVRNALGAAAVGDVMGVPVAEIAAALEGFEPVAGRMQRRPGRRGAVVLDDTYNASPEAVEAALAVLAATPARPHLAVLGDMLELGDLAPDAHRRVGRAAAGVDLLVAVGEHADEILEGALDAGL
ncbi:MAG: UDP-N-acetylmuramoyl-tripeptide--D-alanyl-D-alanine ligase, partial [Chloroflexota bacterium]|nr:UDP-N-acetylmuramoyl-tripeptide--D-alanyl-D-alanine ligase [Chloroflexota bacterium]